MGVINRRQGVSSASTLTLRRLGIDTYQQPVIYMRDDCHVCRAEGFRAPARVRVEVGSRSVIATLNVVTSSLLEPGEAGLSECAWNRLKLADGDRAHISHPAPLDSLGFVRAKLYGGELTRAAFSAIVDDIVAGRYTDLHLAAFASGSAGDRLSEDEIFDLTLVMTQSGKRLEWDDWPIFDKHCVGGLPGNCTTPIVVSTVAAAGLTMPKTSSRAITSPAGTADTMETLAPVDLNLATIQRVVEREGGCIAWGGGVPLSPADDILIQVERALDLDGDGQLVASVLSKKAAAGATHVMIDIPVGPTAKIQTARQASRLKHLLERVGARMGLYVRVVLTDGTQPVGRGIGPALEAHDVVAVLRGEPDAPLDLRNRAVFLAGQVIDMSGAVKAGAGEATAAALLEDGRAWNKFQAICEAQGGIRCPPVASYTNMVLATRTGIVRGIDNRRLARAAKLAGAPVAKAAGVLLEVRVGDTVTTDQALFTVHAESPGELAYALDYVENQAEIVTVRAES